MISNRILRPFLLLIFLSFPLWAQAEANKDNEKPSFWSWVTGTDKDPKKEDAQVASGQTSDSLRKQAEAKASGFTAKEKEVLQSWKKGKASWKQKDKPLPPGLQKKADRGEALPPGWQKKLVVGKELDSALAEEATSLPEEILKRLPEPPHGTEIIQIGDQVVRVLTKTREIIDILDNPNS